VLLVSVVYPKNFFSFFSSFLWEALLYNAFTFWHQV
jgi:hypothetical protein